jgi:hydrogenase-4 component E
MDLLQNPEFGDKLVTLMAAFVLVLQIAMVGQRWLVMNIRLFGAQSFLLAAIAGAIAWYNSAPHIYIAAVMTLLVKAIFVPVLLERLVDRIDIRHEIEPIINTPVSVVISGALTLVAYLVGESFYHPEAGQASLGRNTLAVAISVFLIGFFMMLNSR